MTSKNDSPHLNKITIMEPEGLIFDCDGTLVDTMPIHFKAWSITTEKYGLIFPEDRFYALGGVSPFEVLRILSSEQDKKIDFEPIILPKKTIFQLCSLLDTYEGEVKISNIKCITHLY